MKTLNKTLSLVLVLVMVLGLFGVASATDFKDDAQIENQKAVQTAVALNIINGKDGNTFDPTGIVKRGEMCKMICVALNGGTEPTLGTLATPSFTDIAGHWAEKYVEYCYGLGIVAGNGDGTFAPDATVTGTQAAKMLLIALGYISDYEGFTGESWSVKVNTRAMEKGLYEDLAIDPNAGLNRDNAAQMVYNTLYAKMVRYDYGIAPGAGTVTGVAQALDTDKTMLTARYKLTETSGQLDKIEYNKTEKTYTYYLDGAEVCKATEDYSGLFGMKVIVYYKEKGAANSGFSYSAGDRVYDIVADDSKVIAKANNGYLSTYDTTDDELTIGYTTFKCDDTVASIVDYNGTAGADLSAHSVTGYGQVAGIGGTYDVTFIDNNNNGKIDTVVAIPFTVTKVTFAGATSTTFAGMNNYKNEDIAIYDGIAKDDYVAVYTATCTPKRILTAVKQNIVTGTVTGTKSLQFQVNGMWMSNYDPSTLAKFTHAACDPATGDTISYVAVGAYAPYVEITDDAATSKNVLAVYAKGDDNTAAFGTHALKAKVMLTDGTKKTVTVAKVNGTEVPSDSDQTAMITVGLAYTYIVNSDGDYELKTLVNATNKAGYDSIVDYHADNDYVAATKLFGGKELADDAVVIYVDNDGATAKLYTGKEFKNNRGTNLDADGAVIGVKEVSGFEYASLVVYNDADAALAVTTGANYGYLTADAYETVADGKTYRNFVLWTVDGEKTVKEESTAGVGAFRKGTLVTFDTTATDGVVKNVIFSGATVGAVQAYNSATGKINLDGNNYKVVSDTTIIYVNDKTATGVVDGAIVEADEISNGVFTNNVRYITNASNEVEFLLVDVNNKLELGDITVTSASPAELTVLFTNYDEVTVSGTFAPAAALLIPEGKTVKAARATLANDVTGDGTLVVGGFTDGATSAAHVKCAHVQFGAATSAAVVKAIDKTANHTMSLAAATTDTVLTADGFFATNATAINAAAVPAGVYTYYAANDLKAGSAAGWYTATAAEAAKA
ncbi:MAG: S-layer homology domain-containing protein [Oscillospiraceae bacterium]